MRITKSGFLRYADIMITLAAVLSVVKFGLERERGALMTLSVVAGASFALFAAYLMFSSRSA